jgi:hypothetical protein
MKLLTYSVRSDYGKEYCFTLLTTKRYSLLQVSFDVGEYSKWTEPPYVQISSGNGRLLSVLFTISKFGFAADFCARNWRDETYYVQPNETTTTETST